MNALKLVMTTAGLGRFTAAQSDNGVDLTVTAVAMTATPFISAPSLTALPGEFWRVSTVSGESVGDNVVHMTVQDDAEVSYSVTGFGLFLADGTLFATYSQAATIVEKSISSTLALSIDIVFPQAGVENITFGDTDFLNPPATTEKKGVVELATYAEAESGDTSRVTTGAVVKAMIEAAVAAVSDAIDGLLSRTIYGYGLVKGGGTLGTNLSLTVDTATAAQIRAGTAIDCAITPAALIAAGVIFVAETRVDGASRYRRFSDGTIEMSGISAMPMSETTFTLVFPWPFTTACDGIFATTINSTQSNDGLSSVQEVALTPDQATLFAQNHKSTTSDAAGGFRWFARGR